MASRDTQAALQAKEAALRDYAVEVQRILNDAALTDQQVISLYEQLLSAVSALLDKLEAVDLTKWELLKTEVLDRLPKS